LPSWMKRSTPWGPEVESDRHQKRGPLAGRGSLVAEEVRIPISTDTDIVTARQKGREVAAEAGFQFTDLAIVATAISELARNIVRYAKRGEIIIGPAESSGRRGIRVVARDDGPGIRNLEQAMQEGYSTSGSLGLGLPGVRRLMDAFDIASKVGQGTVVTIEKWRS
jgi:serine/threonine-protein kinase RsbT